MLPRPVLTSLMRGWMMGDTATRGRWDAAAPVELEAALEPEPESRLEVKFTCWGEEKKTNNMASAYSD